ncbi:unnamed protein product [Ranitomeya imitator]|uniref:PiggyBac transposable element-derived protein domain-containing protein n=1 Tax=Ranitomeya imitator TaxID=111125 RepID=A0ABN9LNI2_9NEOB|nr:unnamed protein product [Ranitomeya imitator]
MLSAEPFRCARADNELRLARDAKRNKKVCWGYVKSKRKVKDAIGFLQDGNYEMVRKDVEKAELLNSYFASVCSQKENLTSTDFHCPIKGIEESRISISIKIVRKPKFKSPGQDELHPRVLKEIAEEIFEPLSIIFENSWRTGEVPEDWRRANVVPIFKNGRRWTQGTIGRDTDSPPPRSRRTRNRPQPREEEPEPREEESEAGGEDPQPSVSNPQPSASHAQPSTSTPTWTPVPENFAPRIPDFIPQSGIQCETANLREIDFFKVYFSESIVSLMVEQTNLYALQFFAQNPVSSFSAWSPVDSAEMLKNWGLVLHMGIVKKPELRQYWSTDILYQTPIYGMVMIRKRFEAIHKFLHFRDNTDILPCDDPNFDRLFKIRPVIEHFSNKFAEVYIPQREICVDESLIHFKGRLQFRQYLASKRARYGIKLYKICESTSGYTLSFRVYQGKDTRIQPPECPPALGVSGKIVWDLVHPLLDKGYHLYVDNFYTSIPLFQSLSARATVACGTVRRNQRGLPLSLIEQVLPKGESRAQCSGNMLVVKFKDKRDVFFLTTIHGPGTTATTVRGTTAQVHKPDCALGYNKHMGGVDLSDQVLQPYSAMRKTKVWYKKLAVHIVQMALYNAYVLSRCAGQTNNTFLQFQEAVIKALMFGDEEGAGPSTAGTQGSRMVPGQHFPDHFDYIKNLTGPESVGIGGDYDGVNG